MLHILFLALDNFDESCGVLVVFLKVFGDWVNQNIILVLCWWYGIKVDIAWSNQQSQYFSYSLYFVLKVDQLLLSNDLIDFEKRKQRQIHHRKHV